MTRLDGLIERARAADVNREAAERYVRELDRWARPAVRPHRRWLPWLAAGVAAAAVVVLAVLWWSSSQAAPWVPVRIGDRVAIVADPATAYRVVRADAGETAIAIERGAVTARLWPGARPHRLTLSGLGLTATATGTVYSLAIGASGAVVHVIEGTVEVRADDGPHVVHAGASWPADGAAADPGAGRVLLALAAPPPEPLPPAAAVVDAGTGAAVNAGDDAGIAAAGDAGEPPGDAATGGGRGAPPGAAPTIKDRWHTARLFRGQGKFAAALAECLAIAEARDPTWSPIALVEAVRIALGPLADPDRAIALADRMLRDWPGDPLAAEVRELRCRALRQLGRADCGPTAR